MNRLRFAVPGVALLVGPVALVAWLARFDAFPERPNDSFAAVAAPASNSFVVRGAPTSPPAGPLRPADRLDPSPPRSLPASAAHETSTVTGIVVAPDGSAVPDAIVFLHSPSAGFRSRVSTAVDGAFRFDGVPSASDFGLLVSPHGGFRRSRTEPFSVDAAGAAIEIELGPLRFATVSGRVVDTDGTPVPSLSLLLRTTGLPGKSFQLLSDAHGRFIADAVPVGDLAFETRSAPRLSVRGVRLAANEPRNVTLVADVGAHEPSGRVIDARGRSVIGARVDLFWSHSAFGAESSARRSTTTRADGGFSFSRVGRGAHRLRVGAPGYRGVELRYVVGDDATGLVVELQDLEG